MGTASAKPEKMQTFLTTAEEIRGELEGRITDLRASYDSFQWSGMSMGEGNPDLMDATYGKLAGLLSGYVADENFVAVVRAAFVNADVAGADGVVRVDDAAFTQSFNAVCAAAGIDPADLLAERDPVTVNDPAFGGIPRTSGFVADPVCTATGHFLEVEEDFTWPDRVGLLRWRRVYSSRFVAGGPFGRGWASWATVMLLVDGDDGSVAYQGPDGQLAVFPADPLGGGYRRVAGVAATLTARAGSDGGGDGGDGVGGWELCWDWDSDHPGAVWHFDAEGLLRTVSGPATGTATFVYVDGVVAAVEHDSGRRLNLDWDAGRIVAVRSSCGRVARYRYNDAGDLVHTERMLGDSDYVVDERGLLVEVIDADGVRLCRNTYDDEGRVLSQVSPFGRETVFTYHPGRRTVVSDTEDGPVNVYEHDQAGRLTGLIDHDGHHMQRSFDAEGRCVAATGLDGATSRQEFASDGLSASRLGADGVSERWQYDGQRRVVAHRVDGGPEVGFDYDGDSAFPTRMSGPDGWEMRFEVDERGLVRSITDADGVRGEFDHDADGNVVATTNGLGAVTHTVPHVSGQAARVTMPDGAVFDFERDDAGRLLAVRSPIGDELRIEWSSAGRLEAMVEANGARSTLERGSHGAVERIVDALGAAVELQHDELQRLVGMSAPGGAKWGFSHTAMGLLSLVDDPAGGTWAYDYDAEGRLVTATDPLGERVRQRFNPAGRLVEVLDRSGNATRYSHDALGRVTRTETPDGGLTENERDVWGRPTTVRLPDGGTVGYSYTPGGRISAVRTAEERGWDAVYDEAGRLVAVTDAAGATVRYEWDVCDRIVAVVSPSGRTQRARYDAAGRVVESEHGGRVWHTDYDHANRMVATTDPLGATTRYDYDLRGKLVAATDPLGGTVRLRYDERGNIVGLVDSFGGLVSTSYDAMRRPVAVTDQLGRVTRLARDATGRVVRQELPTGDVVEWQRDARGLATDVRLNGRDAVVFERDRRGRPELIHEPARNRTFTVGWSRGGRLASLDIDGREMRWERDLDGLVVARSDLGGRRRRVFRRDRAGRLASLSIDGWGDIELERDPDGRLVALRAGRSNAGGAGAGGAGRIERRWDHDTGGLVVTSTLTRAGSGSGDGAGADADSDEGHEVVTELVRDGAGRVTELRSGGTVRRFRYDAAGQLVAASDGTDAWEWDYDPAGRLAREQGPDGTRRFSYDDAHQLLHIDGPEGRTSFGYDDSGRRVYEDGPAGTRSFTWDGLGRLTGIETDGRGHGVDVDALGQLAELDGTPFTWDPTRVVPELVAIGDRDAVGVPGVPLGLAEPDGTTTWLSDSRSPAGLADRRRRDRGDPWEICAQRPGAPWLGAGGALDLGLGFGGLAWLTNRIYDPATRQFLSRDPLPGIPGSPVASNPYHYANNSPVGMVDPLGLEPLSIDAYNEIREQETGMQWGNVAMVGLVAASFFIPGGPLVATLIGAGIGMAPGIVTGITTGNWDVGGIIKGGIIGGIAGRVGFAFGGAGAGTMLGRLGGTGLRGAMTRGAAEGLATGTVGQLYDLAPLPGSDGQFNIEDVALDTAIGTGSGGAGHRFTRGQDDFVDLYHSTSVDNANAIRSGGIDLTRSRPDLDFGSGHYTSPNRPEADSWGVKREKWTGNPQETLHYQIPRSELENLNGRVFDGPSPEWEDMVRSQRMGGPPHGYDYVEGPMVGSVDGAYGAGPIDPFGHQLSIHTDRAASLFDRYLQ